MSNEKFLRDCIELKIRKNERLIYMLTLIAVLVFGLSLLNYGIQFYLTIMILILLVFVPFIIYYSIKIRNIKKYFGNYVFYEVILNNFEIHIMDRVYCKVNIVYDKMRMELNTKPIFSTGFFSVIYLELKEYLNKPVMIAYNPILKEAVLVKRLVHK